MRVVLCMSPIGDTLRSSLRQFPSLINCCTISWFDPWPQEGLSAVASSSLTRIDSLAKLPMLQQRLVDACSAIHSCCHDACSEFFASEGRHAYTTPSSFLDLLRVFRQVMGVLAKTIDANAHR